MSPRYYFQLGTTPDLSLRELQVVYPDGNWELFNPSVAIGTLPQDISAETAIQTLGGTVKILQQIEQVASATQDQVSEKLVTIFSKKGTDKVTMGLAELGRDHLPKIEVADLKDKVVATGKRVRYIEGSRSGLTAAVLLHKQVTELAVIQGNQELAIAETMAVQNIDHWTTKDRGKPYANRKKGLLPPKIARIMVNLAVGSTFQKNCVLLDPFCGTGTILIEALEKGMTVSGSDNDKEAVEGARQNLTWFTNLFDLAPDFSISHADATKIQPHRTVDYIVTEPFLGKPKPNPEQLPNIFKGLLKLYLGSFKHWATFLKPGSKIVIAFPRALAKNMGQKHDYTVEKLIDKLNHLGYITQSEPIQYYRPGAIIAREIYCFEYRPQ